MKKCLITAALALAGVGLTVAAFAAETKPAAGAKPAADSKPASGHQDAAQAAAQFIEQYDSNGDKAVDAAEFARFRAARYAETDSNSSGGVELDEYIDEYAGRHDRELDQARKGQVEQTHTRFRSVDKDGDGFISRAEYDASGERGFAHLDSDGNGKVDGADREPERPARSSAEAQRENKPPRRDVLKMPSTHTRAGLLEIYDADGDGAVTREEFDRQRGEAFARTDANKDGRADADEYLREFEDRLDRQIAKNREARDKQTAVRFKALDTDADGQVSPAEYAASGQRMFDRLDTHKDGVVNADDPPPPREREGDSKKAATAGDRAAAAR